jgi:hypothetical protein
MAGPTGHNPAASFRRRLKRRVFEIVKPKFYDGKTLLMTDYPQFVSAQRLLRC